MHKLFGRVCANFRAMIEPRHPSLLFRYRPWDDEDELDRRKPGYLASLLLDRIVFAPSVATFNDPWDCCPAFRPTVSHSDPARAIAEFLLHRLSPGPSPWDEFQANAVRSDIERLGIDAVLAKCHDQLNAELRMRRIICLSSRGDIPLQWSYYARGHTGYALAFDGRCAPFAAARRVTYSRGYPTIEIDRVYDPGYEIEQCLFRKADYWRHESEYRLLAIKDSPGLEILEPQPRDDVDGRFFRIPEGALVAVILGARMPPERKLAVHHMARSIRSAVRVVEAKQLRYGFEIHLPKLRA